MSDVDTKELDRMLNEAFADGDQDRANRYLGDVEEAVDMAYSELRNLITIAYLITRSASHRRESRGLHYTTDYPEKLGFVENSVL